MNQPCVFISCVSPEFRQTRSRVAAILTRLGYTPVIQEIFGTEPGDLRQVLRDKIDACEGLIQIVGQGYGAEPPTVDAAYGRVSYTQFEFLYAREKKKKTWLIFPGDACTRDTPLERLDLPNDPSHRDPTDYQTERRSLQLAYCDKRRNDGHIYYDVTSDADIELKVERLRDELVELRRAEEAFRRELLAGQKEVLGRLTVTTENRMTARWSWLCDDAYGLARYVPTEAQRLLKLGINRLDLQKHGGVRALAAAIYEALVRAEIQYDLEEYTSEEYHQNIRTPEEILGAAAGN